MRKPALTLSNGLRVFTEGKSFGETGIYFVVNSGSLSGEIAEIAHTIEHLLAGPTRTRGDDERIQYASTNATTNGKHTMYYFECLLPDHIGIGLENLSHIADPLKFDFLKREKEAIKHELRPRLNPESLFAEETRRMIFPSSFKHQEGIQERLDSVDKITEDDLERFYEEHYCAKNSLLYIAGDIPADLENLVKRFERVPAGEPVKKIIFGKSPELRDNISIERKVRNDDLSKLEIYYQAPHFPNSCGLDTLAATNVLVGYLSSSNGPVFRRLRDEMQLCYGFEVDHGHIGGESYLEFNVTTNKDLSLIEKEWTKILRGVAMDGIPEYFLNNIKNQEKVKALHISRQFDLPGLFLELEEGTSREEYGQEVARVTSQNIKKIAGTFASKPYLACRALPR